MPPYRQGPQRFPRRPVRSAAGLGRPGSSPAWAGLWAGRGREWGLSHCSLGPPRAAAVRSGGRCSSRQRAKKDIPQATDRRASWQRLCQPPARGAFRAQAALGLPRGGGKEASREGPARAGARAGARLARGNAEGGRGEQVRAEGSGVGGPRQPRCRPLTGGH